jgi:hypothetical protein
VFKLSRKTRILAISVALLLLAYAAFGFLLLPQLLRSQIEEFTARHYRRQPTLGEISCNPFTLSVEVHGLVFADSRGAPLLAFDRLLVNLDLSSLWRRGISFHAIELERPAGRVVVRADGSLNIAELTAPFTTKSTPEGAASGEATRLFIDRLRLVNGAFEFEDHARATPFKARLMPVNFELLDFSTTGETGNHYALQAASTAGERFRWSGSFGVTPLASRGQFELADVQARTLWSYLQESLGFEVAGGVVGVQGSYELAATEPDLTLKVTLAGIDVSELGIRPRGGAEDWVHLTKLAVKDTRIDAARRVIDIGSVLVSDARVTAHRAADGTLNLTKLALPPADATPAATAGTPEPAASWSLNAPDVSVEISSLDIHDEFVRPAARFTVSPARLALRGFGTAPDQTLELDADLTLGSGGRLAARGKGIPAKREFQGRLELDALNLAAFQPYVGTYTQMTLLSGALSTKLDADIKPASVRLAGSLDCSKLHTIDNALREDFIKWERLALEGVDYSSASRSQPATLRIATITAGSPYVRLIIAPDQTTNVAKVLAMPGTAPGPVQTVRGTAQKPTGAQSPMAINIGRVLVQNGSANFADFWITPNYAVSLQQLAGSVSGLSSRKDSRAKLALTGKIDRYAPVEIAGSLNLLSASLFTDIRVKFDGVELTSVTPYSGRFAGYRIEKGKLSVDVRYQVENRKLNAEQRFVVDQLELGERVASPDAVNLPLRLAVALLKDRNGVIDLGLPVTGSLDDPKFRLGPLVWKAFVNLLAGLATSPFKLLGSAFGGGEEVNLIDFDAGSAVLDTAATEKLSALSRALHERPQLALEVPAIYSSDADLAALSARQLEEKLAGGHSQQEPARRFEQLSALYKREKPDAALPPGAQALQQIRPKERQAEALATANRELEAALRPGIEALEPSLEALAQQRARNIQDALLASGDVEPGRVFLIATAVKPAADGRTRVALSLK